MIETKKIWQHFTNLPPEAQREAADFILFLGQRYESPAPKSPPLPPLTEEPFIGMWKKREDLRDSTVWIRGVRQREWHG